MRTFLQHFREHRTTEARRLWDNPDVFGDGPEEQPQSSERQETADTTNAPPEGIRVRVETAEEMEASVQEEALKRMDSAGTESKKEEDLQTKLNREIGILLASIKGLSESEQSARIRAFNEQFLHPLGHHLHLIDGNARISAYTPPDPRFAIYKAKINELTDEISRTTTAINQARIHGIAPMAREYGSFKRGMMRRGNIAPEIQRFMMQFPAAGASALAPDLKKMYEHLAKKQMELAQLKQAGPQSMPLPPKNAGVDAPLREESPARFQRRVPVDRMEFSRGIDTLDQETQRLFDSLDPVMLRSIENFIDSLDEPDRENLKSASEKIILFDRSFITTVALMMNDDGTLKTREEILADAEQSPEKSGVINRIIPLIESFSAPEKKILERLFSHAAKVVQAHKEKTKGAEQKIASYKEQWEKAKNAGDEPGMEIAEGFLLMSGMEIDDNGNLQPLEKGFGGRGIGFLAGFVMVINGLMKKFGDRLERKKKKEEKKNETPMAEMTEEKKTEEMKKSEKRIGELQKEQKELKKKIDDGQTEIDNNKGEEVMPHLKFTLAELKKDLKKVEEEMKKEEARLKTLKEPTSPASAETKSDINVLMEKAKKAIEKSFQEMKQKYEAEIKKMQNVPKDIADSMMQFMEIMRKMITVQKNDKQECRYFFDINSAEREIQTNPQLQSFVMNQSDIQKIQEEMQKKTKIEWMTEGKNLVSAWVSADALEKTI